MTIRLSPLAAFKLELLLSHLEENWSFRTKQRFLSNFRKVLHQVANNPLAFPQSVEFPGIRKVVITKQTTAYYTFDRNSIYVTSIVDVRQSPAKVHKEIKRYFGR